jgi:hypothetical protein
MGCGVATLLVSMISMCHDSFGSQRILPGPFAVPVPGMLLILEHFPKQSKQHVLLILEHFSKWNTDRRSCIDGLWDGYIAGVHDFNVP